MTFHLSPSALSLKCQSAESVLRTAADKQERDEGEPRRPRQTPEALTLPSPPNDRSSGLNLGARTIKDRPPPLSVRPPFTQNAALQMHISKQTATFLTQREGGQRATSIQLSAFEKCVCRHKLEEYEDTFTETELIWKARRVMSH